MRVCHINFSFTIGGIENLLIDVMNEQSLEAEVFLIIVNDKYNKVMLDRISYRVNITLINRPQGNKLNLIYIIKLWHLIVKINPSIIHCHTHNLIQILFPFKNKCIYTIHQIDIPLQHLKKYRELYSISKAVQIDLKKRGKLDSILIYNGIDCSSFSKKQIYTKPHVVKIIQVGRLSHKQKGQDWLIKSIHNLIHHCNITNIHLDIVGDGSSQAYLEDLIELFKMKNYIELIGPKDRTWVYSHLCDYDLLVQPSRSEGFGLTVIEAIASGLPIVASNIHGLTEILEDIPSAWLSETDNVNDLGNKIRKIINEYNNNQVADKCRYSMNKINGKFSVTSTAKNYLSHYISFKS